MVFVVMVGSGAVKSQLSCHPDRVNTLLYSKLKQQKLSNEMLLRSFLCVTNNVQLNCSGKGKMHVSTALKQTHWYLFKPHPLHPQNERTLLFFLNLYHWTGVIFYQKLYFVS